MRTRIRCLREPAPTSSSKERAAQLIARLPRVAAAFRSTVRSTRNASQADLVKAGKRYADWFLRNGTTTIEAKSGYGLTLEDELKHSARHQATE